MPIYCDYCGNIAQKISGKKLYPHRPELHKKKYYRCDDCDAHVGCHPGGTPFGRLANRELRQLKMQAHKHFDKLWKEQGMKRTHAYKWLARQMRINQEECHIGMFDEARCREVIEICKE